jgi:hypothetical protein
VDVDVDVHVNVHLDVDVHDVDVEPSDLTVHGNIVMGHSSRYCTTTSATAISVRCCLGEKLREGKDHEDYVCKISKSCMKM